MASKVDKQNFSNYLAEAKSWETDRVRQLQKSTKTAWWVAIAAGILALVSVITVAVLGPQKTSVPYVIRVNNLTGAVDVVNALKDGATNYDEVMNKYNIQWYVRWREGYSKNTIDEYYKNVGIMSSPEEQQKYGAFISSKNPNSPLNIYGATGNVTITIKSTSFINDHTALVRYIKEVNNRGSIVQTHWATTIIFAYAGAPMAEMDRAVNPLGFQVAEYRNDPDQDVSENTLPSSVAKPQDATATPLVSPVNPAVPPIQ